MIRVGMIGYGGAYNISRTHLQQMQQAGMTPVAVTDSSGDRRRVATEEFPGIETYGSVEEMLDASDINLVVVATPHNSHAALALQCLCAGKHVVCEKPMALTTAECLAMIEEAEERGLLLSVYHNRHWDGCILHAVNLIHTEQLIGRVVRVEGHMGRHAAPTSAWRSSREISGGILYDWGVHLTEYALQLLRDSMTEITGWSSSGFWQEQSPWRADTNEDEALAMVRFKAGGLYTLRMTNLDCDPPPFAMKVTGTQGSLSFSPHGSYRLVRRQAGETFTAEGKCPESQWQRYYDNVAAALTGREDLVITARYALRTIHILDLAGRSAREGRALAVTCP